MKKKTKQQVCFQTTFFFATLGVCFFFEDEKINGGSVKPVGWVPGESFGKKAENGTVEPAVLL